MAGTHEKTVAVAVKKGKYSQVALKWAVENLAKETNLLSLVHVRPKTDAFGQGSRVHHKYRHLEVNCGEDLVRGMEQSYQETKEIQTKEMFSPLISYCRKKNVQYEEVIVEDDDVIHGISDYVLKSNIDVLVVGSGSRGGILRRLRGPETANKIAKSVPYFCTVYTIGKGGAVATRNASNAVQNLPGHTSVEIPEPEIGNHVRSIDSIQEPRISVSAGESLIQPKRANEFEFRSPLNKDGDSDFTWGGHVPPDSDISFISSDNHYDHLSSSYSTNSSNFSLGSFDSWQKSSSINSSVMSSSKCSDASFSSQYSMDEMRMLRLELMQTKKIYEAVCQEALESKQLAGNGVQGSGMSLAKLEHDKDETAAKISNIRKKIAELQALQSY